MKIRLDQLVFSRNLAPSLEKARAIIAAGRIIANDQPADKPGMLFAEETILRLRGGTLCRFVSRGGLKLAAGLDHFKLDPMGFVCADIGASTGGFSDCLLQRGAARIYDVDVGYGQLAWKLRQDPRVVVMERTNARKLKPGDIPEPLDLAVIDASFISLAALIPQLIGFFRATVRIMALIKPQFEAGRDQVGEGGVVRDSAIHEKVIAKIHGLARELGLTVQGVIPSPIPGPKGNREFLVYLVSGPESRHDAQRV